ASCRQRAFRDLPCFGDLRPDDERWVEPTGRWFVLVPRPGPKLLRDGELRIHERREPGGDLGLSLADRQQAVAASGGNGRAGSIRGMGAYFENCLPTSRES